MIEFWFEFGSTYSYPAAMRIERIASEKNTKVSWKAFLLGPIFKDQGWLDSPFNLYPAKGKYMWQDLARICQMENIPFQKPSQFPRNGLLATRVVCWYQNEPWISGFVRNVYLANFQNNLDISRQDVVATCLESIGRDSLEILRQAQSEESKSKLVQQTNEAVDKGIFGAPSFVVDGELFWGNDRLEQAFEHNNALA